MMLSFQYLPPKFKKLLPELIDQNTELEDAGGKRWTVKVVKCDESLVFKQGWCEFCVEHGLEIGDFLVFHYMKGSHFAVQIFGKSAFEKVKFSEEIGNVKKRACTENNSSVEHRKSHKTCSGSLKKHGSNNSLSVLCAEEPCSTIRKEGDQVQEDRRAALWDLSIYEMQKTSISDGANNVLEYEKSMIDNDGSDVQEEQKVSLIDKSTNEMQMISIVDGEGKLLEYEKSPCHGNAIPKHSGCADFVQNIQRTDLALSYLPNMDILEMNESFGKPEHKYPIYGEDTVGGNTFVQDIRSITLPNVKGCDWTSNHTLEGKDHDYKVVKTKSVGTIKLSPADVVNVLVIDKLSFLELPMNFPVMSFKGRTRMERRAVVLLQDPTSRLWPVLYHEKTGIRALTFGWNKFCKANRVQLGDKCVFGVEDEFEYIYRVRIISK
ncbi:hypothetical protein NMG60_11004573 [Bertholletia excelsa]